MCETGPVYIKKERVPFSSSEEVELEGVVRKTLSSLRGNLRCSLKRDQIISMKDAAKWREYGGSTSNLPL